MMADQLVYASAWQEVSVIANISTQALGGVSTSQVSVCNIQPYQLVPFASADIRIDWTSKSLGQTTTTPPSTNKTKQTKQTKTV